MAPESPYQQLTGRERQIMDILYRLGEASAEDVRSRLPDPPSYSAACAMLVKLEDKGQATHFERDLRYVYRPAVAREEVRQSVLGNGHTRVARLLVERGAHQRGSLPR